MIPLVGTDPPPDPGGPSGSGRGKGGGVNVSSNYHPGRMTLKRELIRLLDEATQKGLRDRNSAVTKANECRADGVPLLKSSTVGGWFESGTPAKEFAALWRLVDVLLVASGVEHPAPRVAKQKFWKQLWEDARRQMDTDAEPSNSDVGRDSVSSGLRLPSGSGIALTPLAVPQPLVRRLRGRDDLVRQLVEDIRDRSLSDSDSPGVWVLAGLGGCGKTTVALEVAHQLADDLSRIWWVSADDVKQLSGGLHAVAYDAGARDADFSYTHRAQVLWNQLDTLDAPWLLVLDNVDDPAVLTRPLDPFDHQVERSAPKRLLSIGLDWLRPPKHSCGTVLVTSRETREDQWAPWARLISVDVLDDADGARVLKDLAPDDTGGEDDAKELAQALGGLPLALNLAGSYLKRTGTALLSESGTPTTFADYHRGFVHRLADMAADPDVRLSENERARRALLTTWELSLDLLDQQQIPLARPLLRLLSGFGQAPIPYKRLLHPDLLADSGLFTDPTLDRLNEALEALKGLRLIQVDDVRSEARADDGTPTGRPGAPPGVTKIIGIHPLVRASNRAHPDFATRSGQLLHLVTGLLERAVGQLNPTDPAHWAQWLHLAPHCAAPMSLLTEYGVSTADVEAVTEHALRAARYRLALGLYTDAMTELHAVVMVRRERLGANHPATLWSRLTQALALRENGLLQDAEVVYHEVSEACERTLPPDHSFTQAARSGRARVLRQLGRYEEAHREFRVVLGMRRRSSAPDEEPVLRTRYDIATVLLKRGYLAEAISELRLLWSRNCVLFGESTQTSRSCGVSLAQALREAGETDEAKQVADQVVEHCLAVLEADHPDVLLARAERARVVRDQGRLDEAEAELFAIWSANQQRLGEKHPDTLFSRHELATVLYDLGRSEAAIDHFRAAWDFGLHTLGVGHPDVSTAQHNLTVVSAGRRSTCPPFLAATGGRQVNGAHDATGLPDLTGLPLADALSPGRTKRDAATRRVLRRFTYPSITCSPGGDTDPGGGYSTHHGAVPHNWPSSTSNYRPPRQMKHGQVHDLPTPRLVLTPDDLRAVATERDDGLLVEKLRTAQYSIRLLVLGELLEHVGRDDRTTRPLPPVEEARALLEEADFADPAAVRDLLLYPAVGRWMSHALRRLRARDARPDQLWMDVGYLHALASAAGIKAGITFSSTVAVHDGRVVLPMLGLADLGTPQARTAQVVAESDRAVVRAGTVEVFLPQPGMRSPANWHGLCLIEAPAATTGWEVWLDDLDPFRTADPPQAPRFLVPDAQQRWQAMAQEAWRILTRIDPSRATTRHRALTAITAQPAAENARILSYTSNNAFGGVVITEPRDATDLAVTLVHETRHTKLHAVIDMVQLHAEHDGQDDLHYAPWHDLPRPFEGMLHGAYAFFGVTDFWLRQCRMASGRELRRAQFELAYWRIQAKQALVRLGESSHLREPGNRLIDHLLACARAWSRQSVNTEIATLALDAVIGHRAHWRIRHGKADPAAVSVLAEAWSMKQARPLQEMAGGFSSVLVPDATVTNLDRMVGTLRDAALAPPGARGPGMDEPRGVRGRDGCGTAYLRRDASLAQRLCEARPEGHSLDQEAWVWLGLTLYRGGAGARAAGSAPAARALLYNPELVRAVYAAVRHCSDPAPDLVELAAWIDAPATGRLPWPCLTR